MVKITERKITKAMNLMEAVSTEVAKRIAKAEDEGIRANEQQIFDILQIAYILLDEERLKVLDEGRLKKVDERTTPAAPGSHIALVGGSPKVR